MLNNKLTLGFIITACIYLLSLSYTPYSLQFGVKVLPIVILLVAVIVNARGRYKWLVGSGVIASGVGDVMLALPIAHSFIFGLGAFFIAQAVYAYIFYSFRVKQTISLQSKIALALLVVYSGSMATYVLPSTGEMLIPVSAYLTVITLMGLTAICSGLHRWVTWGALFFVASDSALALSLFKTPLPYSSFIVMFTYYTAQFFIVFGLLHSAKRMNKDD